AQALFAGKRQDPAADNEQRTQSCSRFEHCLASVVGFGLQLRRYLLALFARQSGEDRHELEHPFETRPRSWCGLLFDGPSLVLSRSQIDARSSEVAENQIEQLVLRSCRRGQILDEKGYFKLRVRGIDRLD